LLFFCLKCHIPHQLHLIWLKVSWTITSRISAVQWHLSSPFWKQSQREFSCSIAESLHKVLTTITASLISAAQLHSHCLSFWQQSQKV
jgi:hypothetical protein